MPRPNYYNFNPRVPGPTGPTNPPPLRSPGRRGAHIHIYTSIQVETLTITTHTHTHVYVPIIYMYSVYRHAKVYPTIKPSAVYYATPTPREKFSFEYGSARIYIYYSRGEVCQNTLPSLGRTFETFVAFTVRRAPLHLYRDNNNII